MKIETGRIIIFIIVFSILGVAIHNGLRHNARPLASVTQPAQTVQPPLTPKEAPVVSISKIWPDGATPTKIVHIPDPQEPAKGLLEINLHQGDDVELDFDPFWIFTAQTAFNFDQTEMSVDSGNGFETDKEFVQNRNNDPSSTNVFWMKPRVYRIRLAPGRPTETLDFVVSKKTLEQPLPPVLPQTFDDLTITEAGYRGLRNGEVVVDLTFRNNSTANTLAVAMHDQGCIVMPCYLNSSLVADDGTAYVIDTSGLTGINGMRTRPEYLTSIEPGQELKASLTFNPRGVVSQYIKSFKVQAEIVLNSNYSDDEYSGYQETGRDVLPPNCKIINVIFDVPIRR